MHLKNVALTVVVAAVGGAGVARAQTVVTPADPHGWGAYTYGTSVPAPYGAVSGVFPHLGNGSAEIQLYDQGATEVLWWYDLPTPSALGALNLLSFDWFVSSTSTTPTWTTPAFAMYLDVGGYIIWEGAYNGTMPNAPQDTWVSSNILNDNFWWNGGGTGQCANAAAYQTLAWFNANCFGGSANVIGLAPFLGFGYAGTQFSGAFDNVLYGFDNGPSEWFNFEASATTVPEPASMALLATGLVGLAAGRRRRRP